LCAQQDGLSTEGANRATNGAENVGQQVGSCGKPGFASNMSRKVFPFGIKDFDLAQGPCTQSCPQKMCETWGGGRCRRNKKSCHIFHLREISERYQTLAIVRRRLLTNLSTEFVCKVAWRLGLPVDSCGRDKKIHWLGFAFFLCKEKFPLRINILAARRRPCAQFYPQKL
jgi:hypothetical protein